MENEPLEGFLDQIEDLDEDQLKADEDFIAPITQEGVEEDPITDSEEAPSMEVMPDDQENPENTTTPVEEEDEGNALRTTAEVALAIPTGTVDWGIGLYNKLMPGEIIDLPHIPKFQNDVTQSIRDISSVVVPTIFITRGLTGAGVAAQAKVGWKIGLDPFVKWFSKAGLAGLGGVTADAIAPVQERDHNALGMLKKTWPNTYGWVSNDWATLDDDEPDLKRKKNMMEGLGIGFASDVLVGAGRLAKALKGTNKATQYVPQNEKASSVINKMKEVKLSNDPIENSVLQSAKRRYDQTTELGEIGIEKSVNLDEPILGVHNVYDYSESGLRTGDLSGVYGASVDVVKIQKNIDSIYGRVGSVVTPGAMEFLIDGDDAGHKLVTSVADLLKDSKYGYKASNGRYISHADIVKTGKEIGADLYEMSVPEMEQLLKGLSGQDVDTGARVLTSEAYAGVMNAIKKYSNDFINMDIIRAQGYLATSLAGQVSDMAEGARLFNPNINSVQRAQDQILDRLKYLMQIKGTTSYARGRALNMLNLGKRLDSSKLTRKQLLDAIKNEKNSTLKALERIQFEAGQTIDTLRTVKAERPELLGPLMLAYELTDGKVSTITKLNEYIKNSTGVFKKALVDGSPDMPSAWTQGMWANIYNSVLSSVGTPLKAGASNLALMIERPIATFAGALLEGDKETLKRAGYMYSVGMVDTLQQAFKHMSQVWRRAADDPSSVGYIMRDDIARKNEDTMTLLRSFADASEEAGDYGPSVLVNQIEAMNDMAEHPWLRFSANGMTAFDGFTRSFIASIEARGRAYDKFLDVGKTITDKRIRAAGRDVYKSMFDEKGFITDKAVEYASREIAMNLSLPEVDALSTLIKRVPALKPFLMFPKTSMNMLRFTGSHNPLAIFVRDFNEFKLPANQMDAGVMEEILARRGIPADENMGVVWDTIRAELKGRKAIGSLTVLGAVGLFTTDRLHGNGIYDKTRQRLRREANWKPRTYKGWDGKWYSYDNMGPISDWLALTADVMDNFDTLDPPSIELTLNKLGHLISANLTNKSFTSGLEPLNDVLAGNPAALARWSSSFGSAFLPFSGARNELGRLLEPQLKEVDQDFFQLLANRNIGAKSGLPDLHDWIDGGKVGVPESFFQRAFNIYSPWFKQSDRIGPEKQFLIDIEYDGRPQLRTNGRGVEYTPTQRSQVTDIIGQSGLFKKAIQRVMNTVDGKEFRKQYKRLAATGAPIDRELLWRIHRRLDKALKSAKSAAEWRIEERDAVRTKLRVNKRIERYTKTGDAERIEEILQMNK